MPLQNISSEGFVKEVFKSIQGEGKYAGALQLFVRFAGCSVKCRGCDTDYKIEEEFDFLGTQLSNPIKEATLTDLIYQFVKPYDVHSVAITGGEPLDQIDFLSEFSQRLKSLGYLLFLETSGFMLERLNRVGAVFDIISLDFKLKSTFGVEFDINKLYKINKQLYDKIYIKIVIENTLKKEELDKIISGLEVLNKDEIYLHFLNNSNILNYALMEDFYRYGIKVYFIPQLHKFLEIK
jgi:organic radical activating enzyme